MPNVPPLLRNISGFFEKPPDLMNDWEIGGTQNKWVCPSDRHLQLRAQLKSGWSVRTAAARSPTNAAKVQPSAISDAEQEQIRKVLERVEESRQREQQRIGKMVDRLDKMRKRATGNGVTHCLLCHTEFGLLASKSYAAMCTDCRKYVCQRNCGVETVEPKTGELIFLCKICAESREVLWKKSGAWFYKEMPEYVKPEIAASQPGPSSPPGAWGGPSSSRNGSVRRLLPTPPSTTPDRCDDWSALASPSSERRSSRQLPTTPDELRNTATPRPRIQPSWVKEKVMTSMSVEEDDHSSSESEFVASGVVRRKKDPPTKQITQARREANLERFAQITSNNLSESEESSSPASSRSGSPRRSLATPSSFDSAHVGGPNPIPRHPSQTPTHSSTPANAGGIPHEAKSGNEDARSIDSGVVQSDHSNPVAAMTLSVSSLAPLAASTQDAQSRKLQSRQGSCDSRRVSNESTPRRDSADRENSGSRNSIGRESTRVTTSVSGSSLVTPPPLAMNQRRESPLDIRKLSISSGSTKRAGTSTDSMNIIEAIRFTNNARADSPGAAFMSSPDDDSKQHGARRNALARGSKARPPPTRALSDRDPTRQLSQDDEGGNPAPASLVQASVRRSASGLEPSLVASPVATRAATPLSDEIASTSTTRPPLEPGTLGSIQFNITYKQEQKQIVVHLIRAKNLRAMDKNGFSDPYVKLHLIPGNAKATKLTSKTIEKTLNPEWNEELTYHGITEEDRQRKTLRVTVLDRDRIGSDFLGETRVALKKLPSNEIKKFNLYLEHAIPIQQDKKEGVTEERGKVLVGVQYNIQQGSLFVFMKRGSELVGMDKSGFSDPYCKVSLTPITSKAHRQKTAIKKRTLNPEWDETLPFIVPFKDLPKKTLQIAVYDHDVGSRDDYIGGIVLSTSAKGERGKQWIQVIENPGQTFEYWHRLELDS
ncbi:unnamed protein product, partial [Mesorhabditis belari]|uniref:Rabphilin n=1 Tax=Mesorhabditis belari TaxID=2138241 RepID=A0AAF3E832_9BILA